MKLDAAAVRALNLLPNSADGECWEGMDGKVGDEDDDRSPSIGAFISYTMPWSQPFPE